MTRRLTQEERDERRRERDRQRQEAIDDWVRRTVDAAPPLSEEQRLRISALLFGDIERRRRK